jgi:hypothetical protein
MSLSVAFFTNRYFFEFSASLQVFSFISLQLVLIDLFLYQTYISVFNLFYVCLSVFSVVLFCFSHTHREDLFRKTFTPFGKLSISHMSASLREFEWKATTAIVVFVKLSRKKFDKKYLQ